MSPTVRWIITEPPVSRRERWPQHRKRQVDFKGLGRFIFYRQSKTDEVRIVILYRLDAGIADRLGYALGCRPAGIDVLFFGGATRPYEPQGQYEQHGCRQAFVSLFPPFVAKSFKSAAYNAAATWQDRIVVFQLDYTIRLANIVNDF
jgi:hypothetical protein